MKSSGSLTVSLDGQFRRERVRPNRTGEGAKSAPLSLVKLRHEQ